MNKTLKTVVAIVTLLISSGAMAETPDPWAGNVYNETVSEEWFSVLFNGGKMGFSTQRVDRGGSGYRISGRAVMSLEVMGAKQDMSFSQTYYLTPEKKVIGFVALQNAGPQRMRTLGKLSGDSITLLVTSAGGESKVVKRIPPNVRFLETLGFTESNRLREGLIEKIPVFVTSMRTVTTLDMAVGKLQEVTISGKAYKAYDVSATLHGFTSKMLVTPEGITIREVESTLGIVTVKTSEEEATRSDGKPMSVAGLIAFSLVKPDKPLGDSRNIKKLKILLDGFENPRHLPRDERQTATAPLWSSGDSGKRKMTLPVTLVAKRPLGNMSIASAAYSEPEHIKATPEIQADHDEIKVVAKEIVGDETDTFKAAQKINRWVFTTLKKSLSDSFSALDVLRSKKGECQSHTNLFTALARAEGIPTRVVSGLVYSPMNEGFLYHAWPEVYAGEWIAVDPTLGQAVADATHIKLAEGGVESQVKLIRFIGKVKIRVVDIKRSSEKRKLFE